MTIAFVVSTSKGTAITGGTSNAIDTTGCNLLILGIHYYTAGSAFTVSDSKGNTWTPLTEYVTSGYVGVRLYYRLSPTVGTGHTFTVGMAGNRYPSITVMGFSGVATSSPFDVQNGSTSDVAGTSRQPGSVTPAGNGSLVVSGIAFSAAYTSPSVNSSMTLQESVAYLAGNYIGGAVAYYVQPTAAAINPTFSWTNSVRTSAAIAVFKPAAAGFKPYLIRRSRILGSGLGV